MRYMIGFTWGILLLASFGGWGQALRRLLDKPAADEGPIDWGDAIVLGLSWFLALGGFLNLLGILGWMTVGLLVGTGLLLFLLALARKPARAIFDWPRTRLDAFTLLACLIAYGTWVCLPHDPMGEPSVRFRYTLNPWDDLRGGYVSYPIRMLEQGSIGDDPFNARRSESALGGLSVLQGAALLFLPPTYIHIVDPGLAILALPWVLHGMARKRGWPPALPCALTLFGILLKTHWTNASAMMIPNLFLLSLFDKLEDIASSRQARAGDVVGLALVSAAVLTLKQTLFPGTCVTLAMFFVLAIVVRRNPIGDLRAGAACAVLVIVLLSPWMISSYRASGTLLYPMLGEGYRALGKVQHPHKAPVTDSIQHTRDLARMVFDPRTVLFVLVGGLALISSSRHRFQDGRGLPFVAVFCGSSLVLVLFARIFAIDHFTRYTFNNVFLVLMLSFAILLGREEERNRLAKLLPGGSSWFVGLLALLIGAGVLISLPYAPTTIRAVGLAMTGNDWDPDSQRTTYRELQSAIPPGRRFLAFLPMAHLLDFGRNPINLIDSNCGISPPPGIPLEGAPEEVAQYLRGLGIPSIAAYEPKNVESLLAFSQSFNNKNNWAESVVRNHYLMAKAVQGLSAAYATERFGDDLLVIDLDRPRGPATAMLAESGSD